MKTCTPSIALLGVYLGTDRRRWGLDDVEACWEIRWGALVEIEARWATSE